MAVAALAAAGHRGAGDMFLSKDDESKVIEALRAAEAVTSGEIVLHIESSWPGDVYARAQHWFKKLKLNRTQHRNGVLILMLEKQCRFAIIGDLGIHQHVGQDFWTAQAQLLSDYLKQGKQAEGLCLLMTQIGEQLKAHFPHQGDQDQNELPDNISHS